MSALGPIHRRASMTAPRRALIPLSAVVSVGPSVWSSANIALVAAISASVALLAVEHLLLQACVVALLPGIAVCFNRPRLVYGAILMPVLATTLVLGHWFADVAVGPFYVLDATVVVVCLLTLPTVLEVAARYPLVSTALLVFVTITGIDVAQAGVSRVVLRQSVLGFYSVWVFVGIAVGRSGLAARFSRVVFWSALCATLVFAYARFGGSNAIPVTPVAHSLYIGYGLLFVLLVPDVVRKRRWFDLVVLAQVVMLGMGLVRSIWFALPVALAVTGAATGVVVHLRRQVARLLVVLSTVLVLGIVVYPSVLASIGREAASMVTYDSGSTKSDDNAKWRLTNWRYAVSEIEKHPLAGIGLGQSEVPVSVCGTGCNIPAAAGDGTVLEGADLHNSILAIPLRFGVPGLVAFFLFEWLVFVHARRQVRESSVVRWLFACHVLTGATALTAVVLEGPYMGVFFWLFGGLVIGSGAARASDLPASAVEA